MLLFLLFLLVFEDPLGSIDFDMYLKSDNVFTAVRYCALLQN